MEAGVPVATQVAGNGRVQPGEIPAGRYATVIHAGPYERLVDTTRDLLAWAEENGVQWQAHATGNAEAWAGRFEFYLTDPAEEPDPEKWETELAFLAAG
jgi:effector-binding domain-containing protein